ncbi:hypothetical protein Hdeb2414_s0010g00353041 [Helianthus debilis subsp. tardiflorus]
MATYVCVAHTTHRPLGMKTVCFLEDVSLKRSARPLFSADVDSPLLTSFPLPYFQNTGSSDTNPSTFPSPSPLPIRHLHIVGTSTAPPPPPLPPRRHPATLHSAAIDHPSSLKNKQQQSVDSPLLSSPPKKVGDVQMGEKQQWSNEHRKCLLETCIDKINTVGRKGLSLHKDSWNN